MTQTLVTILPYIIGGLFLLALLLFILSLVLLRRGRKGAYWRMRREAGQRGGQFFLLSLALFALAIALTVFTGLGDIAYTRLQVALNNKDPNAVFGVALLGTITPTSTLTRTSTKEPSSTSTTTPTTSPTPITPTATLTLTLTATVTPSSTPEPTQTPSVTPTPSATFESVLAITPAPSDIKPQPGAAISIAAVASQLTPDQTPGSTGTQFAAGLTRIYLFIDYRNMTPGVTWTRVLYRDSIAIQGQSYLWAADEDGSSYFFFGDEKGYPTGEYEVKLFLSNNEASSIAFSISE